MDFALDVFPALLDNDVPFHVHVIDEYWNDVGSLPEYVEGNLHALDGAVSVDVDGTCSKPGAAKRRATPGSPASRARPRGDGCDIDDTARLDGPLVIGDGSSIGAGAFVKHSVLLPGSQVPAGAIVADAIYGLAGQLG